jgi:hypothetical protein
MRLVGLTRRERVKAPAAPAVAAQRRPQALPHHRREHEGSLR